MSTPIWLSLATQTLSRPALTNAGRVAVLGIGNELNGDDGIGVKITQQLGEHNIGCDYKKTTRSRLIITAGLAPENFTGQLRRFHPDFVILIDAADMGSEPGCVQWLHWQQTIGMSASTHSLPLSILAQYLVTEIGCEVYIIAIQAESNDFGNDLSTAATDAVRGVVSGLAAVLFPRV